MRNLTKDWVTAGDAIFTVNTPANGHYTFRVTYLKGNDRWPESWFVKLLTGPDNTRSYTYLGKLNPETGAVATTPKSRKFEGSFPHRLVNRILARVWAGDHAAYENHGFTATHAGYCGRCARLLTVPESVESGYGPECVKLICKSR